MIDEATRIRVIRALIGNSCREFAAALGASPNSITNWEKGRTVPKKLTRKRMARLCHQHNFCFLPSGMPVPMDDIMQLKIRGGK